MMMMMAVHIKPYIRYATKSNPVKSAFFVLLLLFFIAFTINKITQQVTLFNLLTHLMRCCADLNF